MKDGHACVPRASPSYPDFTLDYLSPAAGEVVATDLEPLFPEGTELPDGVSQREDAMDLSFADASFDCVIAPR